MNYQGVSRQTAMAAAKLPSLPEGPVKGWTIELTAYPNGRPVWIAEVKGDGPTAFYEGPSAYDVMGAIASSVDKEAAETT